MKSGLMEPEDMKKLGFLEENSWESEEQEKNVLFKRINEQKQKAWEAALRSAETSRKQGSGNPQVPQ